MTITSTFNRRTFVKLCSATLAVVGGNSIVQANSKNKTSLRKYKRVLLTSTAGIAQPASGLIPGKAYVFHYPYVTTPCFLINLEKKTNTSARTPHSDSATNRWQGGVGPGNSIVAFSAICAHKLSYPTRDTSFINYRHNEVSFINSSSSLEKKSQVIFCCSENSVYDPAEGARVIGGPAPFPLASIILEYSSEDDRLYAIGTSGKELFDRFFDNFEFRLALDHRRDNVRQPSSDFSFVYPIEEYCDTQVLC